MKRVVLFLFLLFPLTARAQWVATDWIGLDSSEKVHSTLKTAIASNQLAPFKIKVATGDGQFFASAIGVAHRPIVVTLAPATETELTAIEEVIVSNVVGDSLTIAWRPISNTSPHVWVLNSKVAIRVSYRVLLQLQDSLRIRAGQIDSLFGIVNVAGLGLPSQTGNAGKVLTTNGTTLSWTLQPGSIVPVTLGGTGLSGLASGKLLYASATNTMAPLTLGTGLSISGGVLTSSFSGYTTTNLPEGSNLYYTDARAQAAITATSPITIIGGVISEPVASAVDSGPLTPADWNTFNNKQNALTLPLPIAQGGTGSATRAAALFALLTDTTGVPDSAVLSKTGEWVSIAGGSGGAGTMTSAAMTVPSILSVSGSPITTSGTFAVTLATEAANTIFAGPTTGSAVVPTFRAMVTADIPNSIVTNAKLANASVTVTAGTGMSGGGAVALGAAVTLTNAGVTSNVAGSGISVSGATGPVTITNAGVTALTGTANQVIASGSTGSVTLSTPQDINTTSSPTFTNLTLSGSSGLQLTNATQPNVSLTNTKGLLVTDGTNTLATIIDSGTVGSVKANGFIGGYFSGKHVGDWYGNTLPITVGGTNSSTALSGSTLMISDGSGIVQGPAGTTTTLLHGNASGAPTYGKASLTADVSGALPIANGGTGQTTRAAAFNALVPDSVTHPDEYLHILPGGGYEWAPVSGAGGGTVTSIDVSGGSTGLTTSGGPVTTSGTITLAGTLAIANGGTGQTSAGAAFNAIAPMTTLGDIVYEDVTPTAVRLAGNATATKKYLTQTGTGAVSAAPGWNTIAAGDVPTLNQNTTGSAATLTTTRAIYGNNFDGSAALTQIIASTYGGTGNGFTKFSGALTSEKTYTLPNASATILTDNAVVTVAQGGTGAATLTAHNALIGNGTSAITSLAPGTSGNIMQSNGTDWTSAANSALTNPMTTLGDIITGDVAGAAVRLAGNITTTKKFLTQTGDGANSAQPAWFDVFGTANTFTAAQEIDKNGIHTTPTVGLTLGNTTAASSGQMEEPPFIDFKGQGWKTNATAASQTVNWRMEMLPILAAANPNGSLNFAFQTNAGGYTNLLQLTPSSGGAAGVLQLGDNANAFTLAFGAISAVGGGAGVTIQGQNTTGSNGAGGSLVIQSGLSTGTGQGGTFFFRTSHGGSSGSSLQTTRNLMQLIPTGTATTTAVVTAAIGSATVSTGKIRLDNVTNSNTITISQTAPAASRIYTLPDAGADASFVMTEGAQTIAGAKTFSAPIVGDITGNAATVTNGVYTTGTQTIGGAKTFSSDITGQGDVILSTAGKGLNIKGGVNAKIGTATLSSGTVTVNTTAITATSVVFLTDQGSGVLANIGSLSVGTVTPGTSFVINSSNALDSSMVAWMIVEKTP